MDDFIRIWGFARESRYENKKQIIIPFLPALCLPVEVEEKKFNYITLVLAASY